MTGPTPNVSFSFTARNAAGQVIAEVNRELDQVTRRGAPLTQMFVGMGANAEGARKGISALERGLSAVSAEALHATGPFEQFAKSALLFGGGGELMLAVAAGVTAGALAVELLGGKSKATTKELLALADAADKLNRSPLMDPVALKVTAERQLKDARALLARMQSGDLTLGEKAGNVWNDRDVEQNIEAARQRVKALEDEYKTFSQTVDQLHDNTADHLGKLIALDKERVGLLTETASKGGDYQRIAELQRQILTEEVQLSKAKEAGLQREIDALERAKSVDHERVAEIQDLLARQKLVTAELAEQNTLAGQLNKLLHDLNVDFGATSRIPSTAAEMARKGIADLEAKRTVGAIDQLGSGQFIPNTNKKLLDQMFGPHDGTGIINAAFPGNTGPAKRYDRLGNEISEVDELEKSLREAARTSKQLGDAVTSTFEEMITAATQGGDQLVKVFERGLMRLVDVALDSVVRRSMASSAGTLASTAGGAGAIGAGAGLSAALPWLVGVPLAIGVLSSIFGHHGNDSGSAMPTSSKPLPVRIEEVNPSLPFSQDDGPSVISVNIEGGGGVNIEDLAGALYRLAQRDGKPRIPRIMNWGR